MDTILRQGLLGGAAAATVTAAALSMSGSDVYALFAWVGAGLLLCASVIARSPRFGVLATAIGCFAANAYLFSRKWESAQGPSICNVNEYFNCDKVNESEWAMAFGVPVTLFGMAFYAGLALAALYIRSKDDGTSDRSADLRFFQVNTLFAIFNLGVSAFLGYQSYALGALCVMCMSIYAGNALLLWAGFLGLRDIKGSLTEELGGIFSSRELFTVSAGFLLVFIIGTYSWKQQAIAHLSGAIVAHQEGGKPADPYALAELYEEPGGEIHLDGTEPVLGDPRAPYMVVEWADFGCPHCAEAWRGFQALTKKRKDIQLRFKVFPLTGDCNPLLGSGGPERCHAAFAAECARQQGRFSEMGTLLFENQGYFGLDDLQYMANQAKLDTTRWTACLTEPATVAGVLADAKAGGEAGVQGTPSLYLKGTHGEKFIAINGHAEAIEALVDAHKAGVKLLPPRPASVPAH